MGEETTVRLDQGVLERLRQPGRLALLNPLAAAGVHDRVRFDADGWRAGVAGEPVAREAVGELAHGGPWVDRSELFRYARQALATGRGDEAVRLFAICQVWGVGRSGRSHVLAHTRKALASPRLRGHLTRGIEQVTTDRAGAFYQENRCPQLAGWGPSFATMFAYAVATAHAQRGGGEPAFPRGLILDDPVWRALNDVLGWSSRHAAGTNRWAQRYAAYVAAVHYWAGELRRHEPTTTAHTVERLLFELGTPSQPNRNERPAAAADALVAAP